MNDCPDDIRGADVEYTPKTPAEIDGQLTALQDLVHRFNSDTLKKEADLLKEVYGLDRKVRLLSLLALISWVAVMLLGVKALLG